MKRLVLLAAVACAAFSSASAQDGQGTTYGIGAAVLLDKDGYRGVGAETLVIPGLSIQNRWVQLLGPQLDLRLLGNDSRSTWFGPRIEYRFDGFEAADGAIFSGMAERKGGVFAGLAGEWDLGEGWSIDADWLRATARERGSVASLSIGRRFDLGTLSVRPRLGAERTDRRYVAYFYGVRPGEATATRAAYAGAAATSVEVGLDLRWRLAPRQFVLANLNYERYGSAIRNSPLIDASGIPQLVVAYQVTF